MIKVQENSFNRWKFCLSCKRNDKLIIFRNSVTDNSFHTITFRTLARDKWSQIIPFCHQLFPQKRINVTFLKQTYSKRTFRRGKKNRTTESNGTKNRGRVKKNMAVLCPSFAIGNCPIGVKHGREESITTATICEHRGVRNNSLSHAGILRQSSI